MRKTTHHNLKFKPIYKHDSIQKLFFVFPSDFLEFENINSADSLIHLHLFSILIIHHLNKLYTPYTVL